MFIKVVVYMKGLIMNDMIKIVVEDFQICVIVVFGDVNVCVKDVFLKGIKVIEEFVEFLKENVEVMVVLGRVVVKGVEEIVKYLVEYGCKIVENVNVIVKQFVVVKLLIEFFQLQGDIVKYMLDVLVVEGLKFIEGYLKLIGEISQLILNCVVVVAEKVKIMMVF